MNEHKLRETNHIVAFLDLLGAGYLMQGNGSEGTLNKIDRLFDLAKNRWVQENGMESFADIKCVMFSDNILFARPIDYYQNNGTYSTAGLSAIVNFISYISIFQLVALEFGLPFRGGISFGKLYIDSERNTVWGKALADAHEIESEIAVYPRVVLGKEFENILFCLPHVKHDFDGMLFVDCLSNVNDEQHFLSDKIRELIHSQYGEKTKEKIIQKYRWLENYATQLETTV